MVKSESIIAHISPRGSGVKTMNYTWSEVSMHELYTTREWIYLSQIPAYNFKDSSVLKRTQDSEVTTQPCI